MRILLLASNYLNLYQAIENELINQGHEVVVIEDRILSFDCYFNLKTSLKKIIKICINSILHRYEKYWEKQIIKYDLLQKPFDVLFVINGCSFHSYLLKKLRIINPSIHTSLYIWDTCKYYDFARNIKYFDVVKTFDWNDSKMIGKDSFLPFFWVNTKIGDDTSIKYDLFSIGGHHDGRYSIYRKVMDICETKGIVANLKLYVELIPETKSIMHQYSKAIKNGDKETVIDLDISLGRFKDDIITYDKMHISMVNTEILRSRCILDTDRELQTGTTPRVIWALAYGKKIISTNKSLALLPFYNPKQICIIDRNNIEIDSNFIFGDYKFDTIQDYLVNLRIDKWINNFIY